MNQHEKGHINGNQITEQQIAKCVIEEAQFELDVPSDVQTSQQHRSKSTRVQTVLTEHEHEHVVIERF